MRLLRARYFVHDSEPRYTQTITNWYGWKKNLTWKGECQGCGDEGVLGVDLMYRGHPYPKNLLCYECFKAKHPDYVAQTEVLVAKHKAYPRPKRKRT